MIKVGGIYNRINVIDQYLIPIEISQKDDYIECLIIKCNQSFVTYKEIMEILKENIKYKNISPSATSLLIFEKTIDGYLGQVDEEMLNRIKEITKIDRSILSNWMKSCHSRKNGR